MSPENTKVSISPMKDVHMDLQTWKSLTHNWNSNRVILSSFFLFVACIVLAQCRGTCYCGRGDMAVIMKKCSNHEIFIMKIFIRGIFSNFTIIFNHKNFELYSVYGCMCVCTNTSSTCSLCVLVQYTSALHHRDLQFNVHALILRFRTWSVKVVIIRVSLAIVGWLHVLNIVC